MTSGTAVNISNSGPSSSEGKVGPLLVASRVGSARVGSARVGSARVGSARVGSARVGSARVGSARVGSAGMSGPFSSFRLVSAGSCCVYI